jgi:hypothetical protein
VRYLPTSSGEEFEGETGSWIAGFVPESVALRALAVDLRGPDAVTLGEPTTFHVVVRNRLPVPVAVTLPTPRLWGWRVDDAPEADERGYEPPDADRTVAFGSRERRVFTATWDGRIRRSGRTGDVWIDGDGSHELTGYVAAAEWERLGLYDRREVTVC